MKNLTWQNPEPLGFAACHKQELFVAQELINKVKSKCCGIKGLYKLCIPAPPSLNINKNDFDKPKDQRELAHFGLARTDDKPKERLSLLGLSRGAKEEDEVKSHLFKNQIFF